MFFTAIGDAPERVLVSTIDLTGDWNDVACVGAASECWHPKHRTSAPICRMRRRSAAMSKSQCGRFGIPFVFEENGRALLFYAFCGEQGIAAAELKGEP